MCKIGIVIPSYNEEKRLNLEAYKSALNPGENYVLCFVDDGSLDKTSMILNELAMEYPNRTIFLRLERNTGKAEAVRTGINLLLGRNDLDFIGYLDADLATTFDQFGSLVREISEDENIQMLMASRIKYLGSGIKRNFIRHYLGRFFATLVSIILGLGVYDTQCGAKIFRKDYLQRVFKEKFSTKWLFDVEIIIRMSHYLKKNNKFGNVSRYVKEMPVMNWKEIGDSKISLMDYLLVFMDIAKLVYIKAKYDRAELRD